MITLGPEVGHGVRAVVYSIGDDRVLKLPRPETDSGWIAFEYRFHTIVDELRAPCPGHPELVETAAGWGLACDYIPGPTLREVLADAPERAAEVGRLIAEVQAELFAFRPTAALGRQRDRLSVKIARVGRTFGLPVRPLIDWMLSQYDCVDLHPRGLCHGDVHLANLIVGDGPPTLVDWYDVNIGIRAVEVARTLALLFPKNPTVAAVREAYLNAVAENGGPVGDLDRWQLAQTVAQLDEGFGLSELNEVAERLLVFERPASC